MAKPVDKTGDGASASRYIPAPRYIAGIPLYTGAPLYSWRPRSLSASRYRPARQMRLVGRMRIGAATQNEPKIKHLRSTLQPRSGAAMAGVDYSRRLAAMRYTCFHCLRSA